MFQRKQRRFRRRSNGRGHSHHGNGNAQSRLRPGSFSGDQKRNNFRPTLSAEKLFEKYTSLAKEALSSGDKTLSENYLQHADHFMRVIDDKNNSQNQNQNKIKHDNSNVEQTSKNLEQAAKGPEQTTKDKE